MRNFSALSLWLAVLVLFFVAADGGSVYAKEVKKRKGVNAPSKVSQESKWGIIESKDEITDEISHFIVLRSETDTDVDITVCVKHDDISVWIAWDQYLPVFYDDEDNLKMILRFDDGEPSEEDWWCKEGGKASYSNSPRELVELLLKHKKLVARVVPSTGKQRTAVFNITGFGKIFEPYRKKVFDDDTGSAEE